MQHCIKHPNLPFDGECQFCIAEKTTKKNSNNKKDDSKKETVQDGE